MYANGYKVWSVEAKEFSLDSGGYSLQSEIEKFFSPEELSDNWVRIRPIQSSAFDLDFYSFTPRRIFEFQQV